jgi:hypothetical protein
MKTSNILISLVVMVGAILAIFGYYYLKRQADWDEVQKVAIRVDSGIRHETLIALRSKVADLDAALTHYVDGGGARQKENRVLSIRQAIESLEWATDHENASTILDGSDGFLFYEKRPYLLTEPSCAESTGQLFLESSGLARASLSYAQFALTTPDQTPRIRTSDLRALRTKCVSDNEAYTTHQTAAAEAQRVQHLRDYPLQVEVRNAGDGDIRYFPYIDGKGGEVDHLLSKGQKQHVEARGTVKITTFYTDTYYQLIFQVNGKPWNASWVPTYLGSSTPGEYTTTIRLVDLK